MDDLVARLSRGSHPVTLSLRPEPTIAGLREQIGYDYLHVKFTETRGGTELGVKLETSSCDFTALENEPPAGQLHIVGTLTLNYVRVRCVADVDLETFTGTGHLEPLDEADTLVSEAAIATPA
jgi:hypothetical protein